MLTIVETLGIGVASELASECLIEGYRRLKIERDSRTAEHEDGAGGDDR